MEANICDINHLDTEVLLPPRKRLLAGFKKQSSDCNGSLNSPGGVASSSVISPSTSSSEIENRLSSSISSQLHNSNLTPLEIAEASRSAALVAVNVAKAARAAADRKAAIAAKAVVAAKSALELVASFSDEPASTEKADKLKRHIHVQRKPQAIKNNKVDEELAHRLHRAIRSSPRISKNSSSNELKTRKHKKPKCSSPTRENLMVVSNGGIVFGGTGGSMSNRNTVSEHIDSESSTHDVRRAKANENSSKDGRIVMLDDKEMESSPGSKEKTWDDTSPRSKMRGRMKLKMLPISFCTYKDQINSKEDMGAKTRNPTAGSISLYSPPTDGLAQVDATPT